MQTSGLRADQISQVRGYADQKLRVPDNPLEPSNRRISLIVQYVVKDDDEAPVPAPMLIRGQTEAPKRNRCRSQG